MNLRSDFHEKNKQLSFPALRSVLYDRKAIGNSILVEYTSFIPQLHVSRAVACGLHVHFSKLTTAFYLFGVFTEQSNDAQIFTGIGGRWSIKIDSFSSVNRVLSNANYICKIRSTLFAKNNAFSSSPPPPPPPPPQQQQQQQQQQKGITARDLDLASDESVKDAISHCFQLEDGFKVQHACPYVTCVVTKLSSAKITLLFECYSPNVNFAFQQIPNIKIMPTNLVEHLLRVKKEEEKETEANALQIGFLTLNAGRNIVLLLETDPLAYEIPIVGIWIKGGLFQRKSSALDVSTALTDPAVFAACWRYLNNAYLKEKVSPIDLDDDKKQNRNSFLVCLLQHSMLVNQEKPLFFECIPCRVTSNANGEQGRGDLLTRSEAEFVFDVHPPNAQEEEAAQWKYFNVSENINRRVAFVNSLERSDVLGKNVFLLEKNNDLGKKTTNALSYSAKSWNEDGDLVNPVPFEFNEEQKKRSTVQGVVVAPVTREEKSKQATNIVMEEEKEEEDLVSRMQKQQINELKVQINRLTEMLQNISAPENVEANSFVPQSKPMKNNQTAALQEDGLTKDDSSDDEEVKRIQQKYLMNRGSVV